ncbi:diacylglycerol/lipid kinase family protein [Geodermatophilus sp. SYSU D00525]
MESTRARRWEARGALALAAAALLVLLESANGRGLWLMALVVATAVAVVAGVFWFLRHGRIKRWFALALVVVAPLALVVVFLAEDLVLAAVLAALLWAAALGTARAALRPDPSAWALPVTEVPPPRHPFLVMNPRSGGGKVGRFALREKAEELGAEVALLDRPGTDVQQLARDALSRGADLLGVAGGDGTQALVADVAAEHGVPFLVISAGTRNHFALDLGLDREDPSRCLDALRDGVEARIDLGAVNGRPFVNNASFGAYAEIVEDPGYREDKAGTTLAALPDLLSRRRGARLRAEAGSLVVDGPQAVLVSNGSYDESDLAGIGRRSRLDRGVLGVIAIRVDSARQAVELLRGAHQRGIRTTEAREVLVTADVPEVPVGIDGETVRLATPVRCTVRPGVLRVRLPRDRPGVRAPRARVQWTSLWSLALGRPPRVEPAAPPVPPAPVGADRAAQAPGTDG